MNRSSRLAVLGTALAGLLTPLLLQPAQAAAPAYVALGDSYASGTGTRSYIADGTSCQRSTSAYPSLIAAARGYALNFRACSGATGRRRDEHPAVRADLGDHLRVDLGRRQRRRVRRRADRVRAARLDEQLRRRDQHRPVLHQRHAARRGCRPSTAASAAARPTPRSSSSATRASSTARTATHSPGSPPPRSRASTRPPTCSTRGWPRRSGAGFSFADPTSRFVGHAVCDDDEWINGLSNPISESYHPKATGHAGGYTPTVSPLLTGATVAVTADVSRPRPRRARVSRPRCSSSTPTPTARSSRRPSSRLTSRPPRPAGPRAGPGSTSTASSPAASGADAPRTPVARR